MKGQVIYTERAPQPVGPYSQAVAVGETVFISGQVPLDPQSGEVVGATIGEQARQALGNLVAILGVCEMSVENLVKTTVFLADIDDFPVFNRIYEEMLGESRPARSVVAVAGLPKNVRVEIEGVACR